MKPIIPEVKKFPHKYPITEVENASFWEIKGHNAFRNELLTNLKERGVGVIERVIIDKELVPEVCEDSGQCEWSVGEARKLATAIVEAMTKGE